MHLENIVLDAADPHRLGLFWVELLGAVPGHSGPDEMEARVAVPGGPWLDLCLQRVPEPPAPHPRLHLDLRGGADQDAVVARAVALGARPLDIGQGDVPWVVLADPEGNAFCVMEDRPEYRGDSAIAALPLHSADPERDRAFYRVVTGWSDDDQGPVPALRHPSGLGPLLELVPQARPRADGEKNRLHLDVRPDPGETQGEAVARAVAAGAREVDHAWGDLPWRVLRDPSGNELCVLAEPA